jgi:transcriptional regulator with XRE-family HTH domain
MLDVKQIRAARALLDWSQGELALASNLSQQTIKMLENRHQTPRVETMGAIRTALEEAGIEFIPNCGVRLKRDIFRVLEGPDSYLHLLEDVFMTLKGSGEEVLFFYVDNEKLSQPIIDTDLRMRKNGIHFRFLIDEDKPYCLFPLEEYRCIPHRDFHNNTIVIYADKVGVMIDGHMMCHLTRNLSYANTMRRIFERLWKTHPAPKRTLCKETYQ